jgi:hypothetical protein
MCGTAKTGMLVTSKGRVALRIPAQWSMVSVLKAGFGNPVVWTYRITAVSKVLYSLKHTPQLKQCPSLPLERHQQSGRCRREHLTHQGTQLDNVAARHIENMGFGMSAKKVGKLSP